MTDLMTKALMMPLGPMKDTETLYWLIVVDRRDGSCERQGPFSFDYAHNKAADIRDKIYASFVIGKR
jgi:hypothetical protein